MAFFAKMQHFQKKNIYFTKQYSLCVLLTSIRKEHERKYNDMRVKGLYLFCISQKTFYSCSSVVIVKKH